MNARIAKPIVNYKFGPLHFHGPKLSRVSVKVLQKIANIALGGYPPSSGLRSIYDAAQAFNLVPGSIK